ncbi:hypothetical protein WA026_006824 [Henosepilachna vigintioctopunctata]|uniref:Uncharacterized protein n=1 Tax=Henosepilachna vigintioctopunctata TaxID=420089 RepID=A0AAW1U7S1_9CUCU
MSVISEEVPSTSRKLIKENTNFMKYRRTEQQTRQREVDGIQDAVRVPHSADNRRYYTSENIRKKSETIMEDARKRAEAVKEGFAHLLGEEYDIQSFLSYLHTDVTAQLKRQNERKILQNER